MPRYLLEEMTNEWIYEAASEEDATLAFIDDICGAKTIEAYQEYCQHVGVNADIKWWEIPEGVI